VAKEKLPIKILMDVDNDASVATGVAQVLNDADRVDVLVSQRLTVADLSESGLAAKAQSAAALAAAPVLRLDRTRPSSMLRRIQAFRRDTAWVHP